MATSSGRRRWPTTSTTIDSEIARHVVRGVVIMLTPKQYIPFESGTDMQVTHNI